MDSEEHPIITLEPGSPSPPSSPGGASSSSSEVSEVLAKYLNEPSDEEEVKVKVSEVYEDNDEDNDEDVDFLIQEVEMIQRKKLAELELLKRINATDVSRLIFDTLKDWLKKQKDYSIVGDRAVVRYVDLDKFPPEVRALLDTTLIYDIVVFNDGDEFISELKDELQSRVSEKYPNIEIVVDDLQIGFKIVNTITNLINIRTNVERFSGVDIDGLVYPTLKWIQENVLTDKGNGGGEPTHDRKQLDKLLTGLVRLSPEALFSVCTNTFPPDKDIWDVTE